MFSGVLATLTVILVFAGSRIGEAQFGEMGSWLGSAIGGGIGCFILLVSWTLYKRVLPSGLGWALLFASAIFVGGASGALGVHLFGGKVAGWVGGAAGGVWFVTWFFWLMRKGQKGI